MSPNVRFLVIFGIVYVLVPIVLNWAFGPPGMSSEFLAEHKDAFDRYVVIQKDAAYKHWEQRPQLNEPDDALQQDIDFVRTFEAMPEFQAEQQRRTTYDVLFRSFNVIMLVVLVVRFGRRPFLRLVDGFIGEVKESIDEAERRKADAARSRAEAEARLAGIDREKTAIQAATDERIAEMRREMQAFTEESMTLLDRETEDRKRHEVLLAELKLKSDIVDRAIASFMDEFGDERAERLQGAFVDMFVHELERKS